jgi:CBS domain-containing protein
MRVEKLMHAEPAFCSADATLTVVISKMRELDGGFIPIVDAAGRVIGVVTARDAALALATRDNRASEVRAYEAMSAPAITCKITDSVDSALRQMAAARVRRLAVVDQSGALRGVLALRDVVPVAQGVRAGVDRISYEQIMETLNGIYAPVRGERGRVKPA